MDIWFVLIRLILAFLLGAAIGMERELNEKKSLKSDQKPQAILGLRSFSLVTSLGAIAGLIYSTFAALSLVIIAGIFLLIAVFYFVDTNITKDTGLTTELAMIYSLVIGILLGINAIPIQIILAIAVVFIFILSMKRKVKDVVQDIKRFELNGLIAYAIIAVVILPFLPNRAYALTDFPGFVLFLKSLGISVAKIAAIELFNPFKVWLVVSLITGLDIAGYFLEKTIGRQKGWLLTSMVGGFVSSTATTQSLAQQSRQSPRINHLLAAAILANLVSFIQIIVILLPINSVFVAKIFPSVLFMIITALIIIVYYLRARETANKRSDDSKQQVVDEDLFELRPALRFAGIYLIISIFSRVALYIFGRTAFLVTSAIGALAGLDAVMINTAQLTGRHLDFRLALGAFIIANAVNLLGKSVYSFMQGRRSFALRFSISVLLIIASSLIGFFFI